MAVGVGYGSAITFDKTGSTSFAAFGNIIDGVSNESTVELVETTLLAGAYKTYAKADIDGGTVEFDVALDNGDSTNNDLIDLMLAGTAANWKITYSNHATPDTFLAIVKSISREFTKRGMIVRKVKLQITGNPGHYAGA